MGKSLRDIVAAMPADRQERIERRAEDLIAEEKTLQDLRKAMNKTQSTVARKLKIKQENVSRIEKRTDLLMSTFTQYVAALGGKVHFVAEFPDRPPVVIQGIGSLGHKERAKKAGSRKSAARA